MTYEPPQREVVVENGGYGAGVIAGAIIVVLLILLAGWYLVGGLGPPRTGSAPQPPQQPAPSVSLPSVAPSR